MYSGSCLSCELCEVMSDGFLCCAAYDRVVHGDQSCDDQTDNYDISMLMNGGLVDEEE